MDFMQVIVTAMPVILTLIIVQVIKATDTKDKFKKFYFLFAVLIGFLLGGVFSTGVTDEDRNWTKIFQDAIQYSVVAPFVILFKKQLGIRLPGDSDFVPGKFFGYKDEPPLPTGQGKGEKQ